MSFEEYSSSEIPLTVGQIVEIRKFQELGEIFPSDILGEEASVQCSSSISKKEIIIAGSIVVASLILTKLITNYAQDHHVHFRGWNNDGN